MKKKKMKKLVLNKVSIANLDNYKINEVKKGLQLIKGGAEIPSKTCKSNYPPKCPDLTTLCLL